MLARMFLAGAQNIEAKKEYINELNVFPVPDGDTGTNMSLTIMAAAKEVTALADMDMKSLAKAISSGSLRGARGNSGVILSQLLRGFTKALRDEQEINVQNLAAACERAKDTAYKAVMKPKEGTPNWFEIILHCTKICYCQYTTQRIFIMILNNRNILIMNFLYLSSNHHTIHI